MNSLDDYSVNELSELHISQNNEESIPWFTRTIMGGLTTNNAVIDARQEIEGEANPNFGDILQHFKNNGGKFVAWISGHTHSDHFYYPKQYPDILVVVIDQAGALRDHSETARSVDMDLRLCATYYAIDTKSGLLKIVRLGLTSDRFLRPKNMLCYDYIHRKVISEG